MSDNVKDKIKDAGNAIGSAAKTVGENTKAAAGKIAEKAASRFQAVDDYLCLTCSFHCTKYGVGHNSTPLV